MLGKITPNVRGIYLSENFQLLDFYYENPPSDVEKALANLIYQEFIKNFQSQKTIEYNLHTLPLSERRPDKKYPYFLRYPECGEV